ncbi:MAG: acyl-CoA dehydrogenase family protein [Anaerolineae bacterium]
MQKTIATQTPTYLEKLEPIVTEIIEPAAAEIDQNGLFPAAAMRALAEAGLLGLISAEEVGGLGQGHRAAVRVMERVSQACASTSMVLCMHYAAAAVIEAHGPRPVREAIAAGKHTSSLAFSENGSRSHFWAPVGTATESTGNGHVRLDAHKSWVTSAGQVDSYVWPPPRPPRAPAPSGWCPVKRRTARDRSVQQPGAAQQLPPARVWPRNAGEGGHVTPMAVVLTLM